MSDGDIERYARKIWELHRESGQEAWYPEWVLQELDTDWIAEYPQPSEASLYVPNRHYVRHLLEQLAGDKAGRVLEHLAEYVLSVVPGFRTCRRAQTRSTDYDVVLAVEGIELDFRAELGRYVICECKNWARPADFTSIAKFCEVVDSARLKCGILFSKEGITGEKETRDAARQLLKVFQRRGIVILTVDQSDLDGIAEGGNLVTMLRTKYERVRLDLA